MTASWASTAGNGSAGGSKARGRRRQGKNGGKQKKPAGAGQDLLARRRPAFCQMDGLVFPQQFPIPATAGAAAFPGGRRGAPPGPPPAGAFRLSSGSGWGGVATEEVGRESWALNRSPSTLRSKVPPIRSIRLLAMFSPRPLPLRVPGGVPPDEPLHQVLGR